MKLGLYSKAYINKPLAEAIDRISSFGFKVVEITCSIKEHDISLFSKDKILEIKKKIKHAGLTPTIHASHLTSSLCDFDEDIRKRSIDEIKKLILIMPKIGSGLLNVHPGYYPDEDKKDICFNNLVKSVKELLPLLEKTKINMCVENMAHKKKSELPPRLMRTPQEFKKFFDVIKSPYVNMTLDVPHACIAQSFGFYKDITKWSELKPKIEHIHLGGFDGTENHHPVLLKDSIVDYTFFYDLIKDFDGIVILENRPEQVFIENIKFLKKKKII